MGKTHLFHSVQGHFHWRAIHNPLSPSATESTEPAHEFLTIFFKPLTTVSHNYSYNETVILFPGKGEIAGQERALPLQRGDSPAGGAAPRWIRRSREQRPRDRSRPLQVRWERFYQGQKIQKNPFSKSCGRFTLSIFFYTKTAHSMKDGMPLELCVILPHY